MAVLFQLFAVYLLLLLLTFAVPQLQPVLYAALLLLTAVYVLFTVLVPFAKSLLALMGKMPPEATLLIASAGLYYMAELFQQLMKEQGFDAFGNLFMTVMKIVILTLWLPSISRLLTAVQPLIPW